MAKLRPIDDRRTTLVDDEDFDDFYRPENPANSRAPRRAPMSGSRPVSSTSDFNDPIARSRSRRARAAMLQDGFDDGPADVYDEDYDHDEEAEAASTRSRRRVAVARSARRKSFLATKWGRIGIALALVAIIAVLTSIFMLVRGFFLHDARFRIDSASSIQILGNSEINRTELLGIFGTDVGRDIFTVPLAQRRADLQQLPWVQAATVMRLLPNQLRVSVIERVPIAFVREGSTIALVDAGGVILTMPPAMLAARHYSFPVVAGVNASDPPETRADRMQLYEKFITDLDGTATGTTGNASGTMNSANGTTHSASGSAGKVSQQLSEVDVSDPEDVRALMPSAGTDILVHFGDENFATRYKVYQQHLPQWRLQYPHLASIDLRYDRQTVLEMSKAPGPDAASGTASGNDAIDTTPTLAATPLAPKAKPSAATRLVVHTIAKKPSQPTKTPALKAPAKPAAKIAKPKVPAYVQPFDNPHLKPASVTRPNPSSIHG